jgi:hypothetical protein
MHSISIYLINKNQLRNDKIEDILDLSKPNKIKWTDMCENILATTHIPNLKEFGKDKEVAHIRTDYFGGFGNQSSKLWINNELKFKYCDEGQYGEYHASPINEILRKIGVVKKSGLDEFDTIGLGRRRTNADF